MPSMFGDWDNSPHRDPEPKPKIQITPVQTVALPLSYALEVNAGQVTLAQAQEWVRQDKEREANKA